MGMMEKFNAESEKLCEHLRDKADGRNEVEMLNELNNVTLDVIANVNTNFPFIHATVVYPRGGARCPPKTVNQANANN